MLQGVRILRLLTILAQLRPRHHRPTRYAAPLLERLEPCLLLSASGINVVLVDRALPDSSKLLDAISPSAMVIQYNSQSSPAAVLHWAVHAALQQHAEIASLTLLSHGTSGAFELGSRWVSNGNLRETLPAWSDLAGHLASDASIYIYSCQVAQGNAGQHLIDRLGALTGASIYASTNITGRGGDWTLEASSPHALPLNPSLTPLQTAKLQDYAGRLQWIGATSGNANDSSHDYNNTANWANGTIDDSFAGTTLAGNLTLYLSANRNAAAGMNFGYGGSYNLTLESNGSTARNITLGSSIVGDFGATGGQTVTIGNAANPVNLSLTGTCSIGPSSANDLLQIVNVVSGPGGLTLAGAGTVSLSGANTYAGVTTLSSGILDINDANALGTGTLTINGGTIDNTSGAPVTVNNIAQLWGGSFTFGGTNDLDMGTAAISFSANCTITVNGSASLTLAGNISGGANSLSVAGPGELVLSGNNLFSGGMVINTGTQSSTTVVAASNTALGSGTVQLAPGGNATTARLLLTGGITIANPITVSARNSSFAPAIESLSGANTLSSTLSLQVGGTYYPIQVDSGSTLTLAAPTAIDAGALTSNRTVLFMGAGIGNVSGNITQGTATLSLIANQTGTWNLTGYGAFSGGVTLNSGTTSFANGSLGTGTVAFGGNSTLQWAYANSQDLSSQLAPIPAGANATLNINSYNVTFASVVSGGGSLIKTGSADLILSAANTFSGGLTLDAGKLILSNTAALGTGTFTINGGSIDDGLGYATTLTTNNPMVWAGNFTFLATNSLNMGTGQVTLAADVQVTTNRLNFTIGGTITGAHSLTKAGNGTIVLDGLNTYTGGTVLAAGAIAIDTASAIGTGTLTINAGTIDNLSGSPVALSTSNPQIWAGDFTFGGSNSLDLGTGPVMLTANRQVTASGSTLTVGGTISGTYSLTLPGPGNLTLSGANTFTGGVTLSGGGLNINNPAALGTGTFTINGGTLGNTSGSPLTLSTNNPQVWNATLTFAGPNDLNMGAGPVSISSSRTVWLNAGNLTIGGNIAGAANTLTVNGAGRLILSGTNSLGTVVVGYSTYSTLRITSNGALGAAGVLLCGSSKAGKLELAGGITIPNPITYDARGGLPGIESVSGNNSLSGTVTISTGGSWYPIFVDSGAMLTFSNASAITGWLGGARTIILQGPGSGAINGAISGSATIVVNSGGIWTLSGANSHVGGTTLSAGTLNLNNASALGAGTFTINGGTLDNTSGAPITLTTNNPQVWRGSFTFLGDNNLDLGNGPVSLTGNPTVSVSAGTLTVDGAISGAYTLSKAGAGTLVLAGANTFTGGLTLLAGTLDINNASALGTGTFTIGGGTIDNTSGAPIALATNNSQAWNASFTFAGTNDLDLGAGTVTLAANIAITDPGGTLTLRGAIAGTHSLSKAGSGTLVLNANSSWSGGLTLLSGTLDLGNAGALGSGTFTVLGGSFDNTTGGDVTLPNPQSWGGDFAFIGTNNLTISGSVTLTASSSVIVAAKALAVAGLISGTFALTKSGSGNMTLAGANTYTGGTTVSAGVLYVNNVSGSGTGAGSITVSSGAILGGTGAVGGPLTVAPGATLSPGIGGPSTLATGSLSLANSAVFQVDLDSSTPGAGYDQLNVTGPVNLAGSTLALTGTRPAAAGDQITLISNDGTDPVIGTFNNLPEGSVLTLNGVNYTISYLGGSGNDVVLTDASPSVATAASATPNRATGTSTFLSVLGDSSAGESSLTYTWATLSEPSGASPSFSFNGTNLARNTTVTFNEAGSYTFSVTISDGANTATSSVVVQVDQTPSTIRITPGTTSLNEKQTRQFTAGVFDQFGNAIASPPVIAWSVASGIGSMDASGLYTAPAAAGSATIQASCAAAQGTAAVAITNAPPTLVSPAAASESHVTGTTTLLSVLAADDGGESALKYTWSLAAQPPSSNPSFNINGSNAAKNTIVTFDRAGSYTFLVTISDGNNTATDSIALTVAQSLTRITISPATSTLNENRTAQFTASAEDQFGSPMALQPHFTWSLAGGVGMVNAKGLYSSFGIPGTATVQAATGGLTGSAHLVVTAVVPPLPAAPLWQSPTPDNPSRFNSSTPPALTLNSAQTHAAQNDAARNPLPDSPDPRIAATSDSLPSFPQAQAAGAAPELDAHADPLTSPAPRYQTLAPPTRGRNASPSSNPRPTGPSAGAQAASSSPAIKPLAPAHRAAGMSLGALAHVPVRAPAVAQSLTLEDLLPESQSALEMPRNLAVLNQAQKQVEQDIQKLASRQKMIRRAATTIVTVSVTASAGYLIWIARGGSLVLSMLTSAPIWRFLDPLPVLNSFGVKRRKRRWFEWRSRPDTFEPGEEKIEKLMD